MSCRCCQPGGDSEEEDDYEEQEGEEQDRILHKSEPGEEAELLEAVKRPPAAAPKVDAVPLELKVQSNGESDRVQSLVEAGITRIPAEYVRPLEERPQLGIVEGNIPVVDLGRVSTGEEAAVRAEIGTACAEWGLFQVINHGVSSEVLDAMRADSRGFFGLPMDEKLRYACKLGTIAAEGYGNKMLVKDDQVLDWRDYFDFHTLPISRRNSANWPSLPSTYRQTVEKYSEQMRLLAERLLGIISESLGLPRTYIKDAIGEPSQNVSVNYYPACPEPDLTLGLQAHSDLGAITILMQADVAGLQVCKDGFWIAVTPVKEALVINLGDMMEVMSNGKYKSAEHRAVVNAGRDRLSIATFLDPAKDRVLGPAPALVNSNHPLRYKDVMFQDFIGAWYSKGPDGKRNLDNLAISPLKSS